mgnify:CR=1 FL=1
MEYELDCYEILNAIEPSKHVSMRNSNSSNSNNATKSHKLLSNHCLQVYAQCPRAPGAIVYLLIFGLFVSTRSATRLSRRRET